MKNNKGQALVEFVILIPVLMLLILSIFDLGNIILKKYKLENELDTIINYYNNNDEQLMNSYASMKDISIKKERKNNNMIDIKVSYEVNINTPVLNKIMGENYQIETSRIVYER
jgi:Flp pilus assembly protein TadG